MEVSPGLYEVHVAVGSVALFFIAGLGGTFAENARRSMHWRSHIV